mgnify:CR=1 FL=1
MTIEVIFVLSVLLATLGVVGQHWLSVDVALMAALGVVTVGGVLEPREAVAGFASTAIVAIGSLYVLAAAAGRVGLLDEALRPWGVPEAGAADSDPAPRHVAAFSFVAGGLVILPIAGLLPFATAALFGAVAVVVSGVLSAAEAREAVDWQIIISVGAVVGLWQAVAATGAVRVLGDMLLTFGPALQAIAAASVGAAFASLCASRSRRRLVASGLPLAFAVALHFVGGVMF